MKFTKYNNPNKRRRKAHKHSCEYIEEQRAEMYRLMATAKTDAERDLIVKAFYVTINP